MYTKEKETETQSKLQSYLLDARQQIRVEQCVRAVSSLFDCCICLPQLFGATTFNIDR